MSDDDESGRDKIPPTGAAVPKRAPFPTEDEWQRRYARRARGHRRDSTGFGVVLAVILVVFGLGILAVGVMFVLGLRSWGSNK
jgi:hypothetical protein